MTSNKIKMKCIVFFSSNCRNTLLKREFWDSKSVNHFFFTRDGIWVGNKETTTNIKICLPSIMLKSNCPSILSFYLNTIYSKQKKVMLILTLGYKTCREAYKSPYEKSVIVCDTWLTLRDMYRHHGGGVPHQGNYM